MIWQTVSTSSDDTERLGKLLGSLIKPPQIIELSGDLGAGKTTFARGLVSGFGSEDTVSSPSFTISQIYKTKNGRQIHHYDFYRLSDPGVLADQLAESLHDPDVLTLVEWSQSVKSVLPPEHLNIKLNPVATSTDERKMIITYPASAIGLIERLKTNWQGIKP